MFYSSVQTAERKNSAAQLLKKKTKVVFGEISSTFHRILATLTLLGEVQIATRKHIFAALMETARSYQVLTTLKLKLPP